MCDFFLSFSNFSYHCNYLFFSWFTFQVAEWFIDCLLKVSFCWTNGEYKNLPLDLTLTHISKGVFWLKRTHGNGSQSLLDERKIECWFFFNNHWRTSQMTDQKLGASYLCILYESGHICDCHWLCSFLHF